MEPDDLRPGERVFHVSIQGKPALAALDVAKESGGRNRSLVKEFAAVGVADELRIELMPDTSAKERLTLLSGIEILAESW
jgi:hypothetical protein